MADIRRVEFNTIDGVTLRGDFYKAEGKNVPVVVMMNGLTLVKEHFLAPFTLRFQAAGISALAYDQRGLGSSDGLPRHEFNLQQQAQDCHDAVSAAMHLPDVDPAKVVIWGIGHGGGGAMIAGADDPRTAAVIVHAPFYSGAIDAATFPPGSLERAWREREEMTRMGGVEPAYVTPFPTSLENAKGAGERTWMTGEAMFGFISGAAQLSKAAGTPWQNRMTLQSFIHVERVEAHWHIGRIKQPLLYVIAEDDPVAGSVEQHRAIFGRAGPNGEFRAVPANPDAGFPEWFDPAIDIQLEFLRRVV